MFHEMTAIGDKTRVLILGGGFAGVEAARYLDRTAAKQSDVEVTLVGRDNWILGDPHQNCLLIHTRLEASAARLPKLRIYVLCAPHLEIGGWHNDGEGAPPGALRWRRNRTIPSCSSVAVPGAPHGMCSTLKNEVNAELLNFFKQSQKAAA